MFELKRWEPLKELSGIQREMDELVKRFFGGVTHTGLLRREFGGEWSPTVDCYVKDNAFTVHADLPGIDPKNVDISITGNMLTIRGERKAAYDEKKEGYSVREVCYGSFERTITLPEGVDASMVRASYKNGVLELTMPAKAEALPRKIKVEVEEARAEKKAA